MAELPVIPQVVGATDQRIPRRLHRRLARLDRQRQQGMQRAAYR